MNPENPDPNAERAFTRPEVTRALEQKTDEPTREEALAIHADIDRQLGAVKELERRAAQGDFLGGHIDRSLLTVDIPRVRQYLENVKTIGPDMAAAGRSEAVLTAQKAIKQLEAMRPPGESTYADMLSTLKELFPEIDEMGGTQTIDLQEARQAALEAAEAEADSGDVTDSAA